MKPQSILTTMIGLAVASMSLTALAQDQVTHFTEANGTKVTLTSGLPPASNYGPAPSFAKLDSNHDGYISTREAKAYPPLLNDFEYAAHNRKRVTKAEYERWTRQLGN